MFSVRPSSFTLGAAPALLLLVALVATTSSPTTTVGAHGATAATVVGGAAPPPPAAAATIDTKKDATTTLEQQQYSVTFSNDSEAADSDVTSADFTRYNTTFGKLEPEVNTPAVVEKEESDESPSAAARIDEESAKVSGVTSEEEAAEKEHLVGALAPLEKELKDALDGASTETSDESFSS